MDNKSNAVSESRVILEYHQRSKHKLERYAPGPGYLDWANQPDPFRTYQGAPRVALPLAADGLGTRFSEVRNGGPPMASPLTLDTIAILFELSFAISAWKSYRQTSWALRCNPSSGNLHPTEAYLVTPQLPGLDPGIYHYVSRDHVLECRAQLSKCAWVGGDGIVVGVASIYWREAWKYGMRAFRYCQHDCGHAIAALSYAAASLGWQTRMLDAAADKDVAALLGLDRDIHDPGTEREEPDCLLWIGTGEAPSLETLVTGVVTANWVGVPNRLSDDHVEWPDIERVHHATLKSRTEPGRSPARPVTFELTTVLRDMPAAAIFRQRRSAVDFDAQTSISDTAFYTMLEPLLHRADAPPWNVWSGVPQVHLGLFIHRVEGLEPGLYAFLRDASALRLLKQRMQPGWLWRPVGPVHLPLYLLVAGDFRENAKLICCHQDIAADSCFALGMLACFEDVERSPWHYRRLFWECGMIGHTLYLEAEAAKIRATGIGCYFDDEMHELLGLKGDAWQSLYHFTVGGPMDDARLTTLPPYGAQSAK